MPNTSRWKKSDKDLLIVEVTNIQGGMSMNINHGEVMIIRVEMTNISVEIIHIQITEELRIIM
jgi:hypothetical protein